MGRAKGSERDLTVVAIFAVMRHHVLGVTCTECYQFPPPMRDNTHFCLILVRMYLYCKALNVFFVMADHNVESNICSVDPSGKFATFLLHL